MQDQFQSKIDVRVMILNSLKENKDIFKAIELVKSFLKEGNKILVFGNGGSATQSSHFASELVNKFYFERDGLPAIALTSDIANLTSIANDFDFKYVFSKQIQAIGNKNDISIGITTSGKSINVIEALTISKKLKLKTIVLCGENVELFKNLGIDVVISVDSNDTPIIQEAHLFILHTIAEILEKEFFGKSNKKNSRIK